MESSQKTYYFINNNTMERDCITDTLTRLIRFGLYREESEKELLKVVSEVNQTESVTDDIFLSDNVYEYVGNGEFIMH